MGTITTDASGMAPVSVPAVTPGSHEMRVDYAGDASHKKAQDTANFTVTSTGPTTTSTTTTPPPDPTTTTTTPPPDPATTTTTTPPTTTTTTPTGPPPDAPNIVLLESPLSGFVYLQWSVPADNGSEILHYNIYRGLTTGDETFLRSRSPDFDFVDDFDVIAGVTYY